MTTNYNQYKIIQGPSRQQLKIINVIQGPSR